MRERIASGFQDLLKGLSFAEVERNIDPVYGLWADMRLAYFNPAWFSFAKENGGEPAISSEWKLGRSVLDAIPPVIQGFYRELFQLGLRSAQQGKRRPISHEYECSSASVYRRYVFVPSIRGQRTAGRELARLPAAS